MEPGMPDDPQEIPAYTRTATETVQRGDLYIPLADRFDKIERRVSLLTWVVVIEIALTLTTNTNLGPELVKLLARIAGG